MASANRSTSAQHSLIANLLGRLDLDDRFVTLMHRRWGAPDAMQGRRVEEWLATLTLTEASELIRKLRAELDDGDED